MDKYKELIAVFSDVLEKSKDYHISYIYQVGYVSLVGLLGKEEKQNVSMVVDEIFTSPEKMAESLLCNWRWQWFYENKDLLPRKDYDDICMMVVSYGNALLHTGQAENALGFEGIYDEFASVTDFVYLMGNIYKDNLMPEQALTQYQKALQMPPGRQNGSNSFLPLYQCGLIFEQLGETDSACALYAQCGDFAPAVQRLAALKTS